MLIKILLTLALAAYFAYAQFQRRTSRIVSALTTATSLAGLVLVWNPSLSNILAQAVGVGRGADLVFYAFIATAGLISLYLHLRVEACAHLVTELARAIALQTPQLPAPEQGEVILLDTAPSGSITQTRQ